jgi:hypothetical protein
MPALLSRRAAGALLTGLVLLLGGCNDNDNSSNNSAPATTATGRAAVGAPLAGAVIELRCSGGAAISTVTGAAGGWNVTVARDQLPCAIRASGGTVGSVPNTQTLYSLTVGQGSTLVANVTPLTTLVLADAANAAPSAAWFYGLDAAALQALDANLDAAIAALVNALQQLGYAVPSNDFNPFTLAFVPESGNAYDDLLEQLKAALASNGSDLDTVSVQISNASLGAAPSGAWINLDAFQIGGDIPIEGH